MPKQFELLDDQKQYICTHMHDAYIWAHAELSPDVRIFYSMDAVIDLHLDVYKPL